VTRDHYIALVGRIVHVVEILRDEPQGLSLHELSSRAGYVKSSVHRILHSLRKHGYIEQDRAGGRYRLGVQFLVLASRLASRSELVQMSRPCLIELVERFKESAYLAELRGGKGVFTEVEEAPGDFRLVGPLGAEVHFHATAAGKAMAAYFPEYRRTAILHQQLPALTDQTKTDPSDVARDWETVRVDGFALNDQETILGAVFLAAPLFDSRERVCGSLSVGLPKVRFSSQLSREMAVHLKIVCHRLSDRLRAVGYVHVTGN